MATKCLDVLNANTLILVYKYISTGINKKVRSENLNFASKLNTRKFKYPKGVDVIQRQRIFFSTMFGQVLGEKL